MTPYIFLVLFPILVRCLPSIELQKKRNAAYFSFFICLFLILAFRNINVGVDLLNYKNYFLIYIAARWDTIPSLTDEVGYAYYNKIVALVTDNFQWFLAITAGVMILAIAYVYAKHGKKSYIEIILFVNMSTFVMMFSGLRQAIAFSIGALAFHFVTKNKWLQFLILVALAYTIHYSAIILLAIYPIYNWKLKKKHLHFIIPAMIMIFLTRNYMFNFLLNYVGEKYQERYGSVSSTGAYTMIILFVLFCIMAFIIPDETKMSKETYGLRNILLWTTVLQFFATLNPVAMRFNYYTILLVPLIVSQILAIPKPFYRQVATLARYTIIVFFVVWFIYSGIFGDDILQVFPYIPFWEG